MRSSVRLPPGSGFITGVLHAQKPFWVGAFVGSRIAVEENLGRDGLYHALRQSTQ